MKCRIVSSLVLVVAVLPRAKRHARRSRRGRATSPRPTRAVPFPAEGPAGLLRRRLLEAARLHEGGLGQLTTMVVDKLSPGMATLTKCLAGPHGMKSAASISYANKTLEDRIVIDGLKIADVARCGQEAGLKTTVDADNRFVSVELPMPMGTFDSRITRCRAAPCTCARLRRSARRRRRGWPPARSRGRPRDARPRHGRRRSRFQRARVEGRSHEDRVVRGIGAARRSPRRSARSTARSTRPPGSPSTSRSGRSRRPTPRSSSRASGSFADVRSATAELQGRRRGLKFDRSGERVHSRSRSATPGQERGRAARRHDRRAAAARS